jgi:hypothetical protein
MGGLKRITMRRVNVFTFGGVLSGALLLTVPSGAPHGQVPGDRAGGGTIAIKDVRVFDGENFDRKFLFSPALRSGPPCSKLAPSLTT